MANILNNRLFAAFVVCIVLLAAYFVWLRQSDITTHFSYATYENLAKSSGPTAELIRSVVPLSARNVIGWSNVEFDAIAFEFEFDPADREKLLRGLRPASGKRAEEIERKIQVYGWKSKLSWPMKLDYLLESSDGQAFAAIDVRNSHAFYVGESH